MQVQNDDDDNGIGGFNATGPAKTKDKPEENEDENDIDMPKTTVGNNKKTAQEKELEKKAKIEEWKASYEKRRQFLLENGISILTMLESIEFDKVDVLELSKIVNNIPRSKLDEEEFENLKCYFKYLRREICDVNIIKINNNFFYNI